MTTFSLPSLAYGYVVGRIIRFVADTTDDGDLPEAIAATGKVLFKAKDTITQSTNYSAFVLTGTVECPLNDQGYLINPQTLQPGIWLSAGVWRVEYVKDASQSEEGFAPFEVEVTTAHTELSPLDLVSATSYVPPTGTVVQTLLVTGTIPDGFLLAKSGSSVIGVDPASFSKELYVGDTEPVDTTLVWIDTTGV